MESLPGVPVELPAKADEAPKYFLHSHFRQGRLWCWWRNFFLLTAQSLSMEKSVHTATLLLDMELLGCQKKLILWFRPNTGFFFAAKFSTIFSSFSFSVCSKWSLDKSTLWRAASVHHTSSVKYCLISNGAHMFSTDLSWSKLCCYLHLNFLAAFRVFLGKNSATKKKTANYLHQVSLAWKSYWNQKSKRYSLFLVYRWIAKLGGNTT